MIFIANASFPQASVKQAAKIYGEMKKLPAAIQRLGPYFLIEPGQVIKVITVYETDSPAWQEVKKFLEKRYAVFADISGFSCKVEQWRNLPDAIALFTRTPRASGA
jgi:hypothetical protein